MAIIHPDNLDTLPMIPARWFRTADRGPDDITLIVVHCMQAPERDNTAENVAEWFRSGLEIVNGRKASAHVNVDNNSAVRSVHDRSVAFAAPHANRRGVHVELTGYAEQTAQEWADEFSALTIDLAAQCIAAWCIRHRVPALRLTDEQLHAGAAGIVGHDQCSRVLGGNHTDPGKHFPWARLMRLVEYYVNQFAAGDHDTQAFVRTLWLRDPFQVGRDVTHAQRLLASAGYNPGAPDGWFGPATAAAVEQWTKVAGFAQASIGPDQWSALAATQRTTAPVDTPTPPPPAPAPAPKPKQETRAAALIRTLDIYADAQRRAAAAAAEVSAAIADIDQ